MNSSLNAFRIEYLPYNTTHLTQPLDVGVFGPLSGYYTKHIRKKMSQQPGTYPKPISKGNFIKFYKPAHKVGITQRNIQGA
jgi:hypothetical protein